VAEKPHICARMVEIIEASGQSVAQWEKDAKKNNIKVSGGYLRKAAIKHINIGIDLVEYFLAQFPDVNVEWLIKGVGVSRITDKNREKSTTEIKSSLSLKDLPGEVQMVIDDLSYQNKKLVDIVAELVLRNPPRSDGTQ
jgi:hypothetical protein